MELIPWTMIFRHILPTLSKEEQLRTIKDIELVLASGTEWYSNRIQFLRASENKKATQIVAMPPTIVEAVVRLGLVGAYQQNEINALHIRLWLDDYNCLLELNDAIIQGMNNKTASPIWNHFLDAPVFIKSIDIDEVMKIVKSSSNPGDSDDKK